MKRILLAVALWCAPLSVQAQWAKSSTGEWSYTSTYRFSLDFDCANTGYSTVNCQAIDRGVRILSGSAWIDLTFEGFLGSLTVMRAGTTLELGTLGIATGGVGPAAWPTHHPNEPFVTILVKAEDVTLGVTKTVRRFGFRSTSETVAINNCCYGLFVTNYFLPVVNRPVGANFEGVEVHSVTRPVLDMSIAEQPLYGTIRLIPEPSTYALMVAALGMLLGFQRVRHRRQRLELSSADRKG